MQHLGTWCEDASTCMSHPATDTCSPLILTASGALEFNLALRIVIRSYRPRAHCQREVLGEINCRQVMQALRHP